MKASLLCLTAVLVVLLQLADQGEAVCCPTHRLNKHRLCDDCRDGTPYCGKGRCNWFGCNCVGGCKRGLCGGDDEDRRRRRSLDAHDVIIEADMNEDGRVSRAEAHAHLAKRGIPELFIGQFLHESDLNKDDFLSPEEVDP